MIAPIPLKTLIQAIAFDKFTCASKLCGMLIEKLDEYWVDKLSDAVYCKRCGINLRYHRKKAMQRGEKPPITFEHVDERLGQR